MDALADILARAHARGGAFGRTVLAEPWGVSFDVGSPLSVHAVLGGEAWVGIGDDSVRLLAGDLALVRGPGASHLGSTARPKLLELPDAVARFCARPGEIAFPGPRTAEVVCGAYSFAGHLGSQVLDALPAIVHLPAGADTSALRPLLALLGDEVGRESPGQQVVLDRFLDLILVYALRSYFSRPDAQAPAWYRALADRPVAAALRAIHSRPAHRWTVAELAGEAGLSRAAFARRFAQLVGEPPLGYLTSWRIKLAQERLRDPTTSLAQVASEIGYGTEFAFSAAFRRHVGMAPGRWRAQLQP
jgi:AraC-like DNA-binding protein